MKRGAALLAAALLAAALAAAGVAAFLISRTPPPAEPRRATTGRELYERWYCTNCHGEDGSGPRADLRPLGRTGDVRRIKTWIRDPAAIKPDALMPKQRIPEPELAAIASHVIELGRSRRP